MLDHFNNPFNMLSILMHKKIMKIIFLRPEVNEAEIQSIVHSRKIKTKY